LQLEIYLYIVVYCIVYLLFSWITKANSEKRILK